MACVDKMTLEAQLTQLENAQLVSRAGDGDPAYSFKHALTQETAYNLLLVKKRREIHRLVADTYKQLYPNRLDKNAALLAHHYAEAGDDEKAFVYEVRAGNDAARLFAYAEASAHYAQALDALTRLSDTEEHRLQQVDTLLSLVGVSLRAQGPVETLKRLSVAETLVRPLATREGAARENRLRLGRVQYWQGQALIHHNETRAAILHLREALQVARAENDPQLLAIPASVIGRTLVAQGRFADAVITLTDAVRALEQVRDDHEWVLATGFRGVAMTMQGDCAAGIAEAERALAHAAESNRLTSIALAHGTLGVALFFGDPAAPSVIHARAMIETAAKSGDRLYVYTAFGFLGWADGRAGKFAEADNDFAQAQAIAQEIGGQLLFADWFAAARAELALRCGQVERAFELAAQLVDRARENPGLFGVGLAERTLGQALTRMKSPRLDEAEAHFANSLSKFEEGGARLEAARTRVAWSHALAQRGDPQASRKRLEEAAAQFQVSGLAGELQDAQRMSLYLPQ